MIPPIRSESPEQTQHVGCVIGKLLREGEIILLIGDLGAGKTQLVRGIADALGVDEPVTSPTFVLVQEYETNNGAFLHHADLYRLEDAQEVDELAIDELVVDGDMAVIEWGDKASTSLAQNALVIEISYVINTEHVRDITFTDVPENWRDRLLHAEWTKGC